MDKMRFRLLLGAALVAIAPAAEAATFVWNGGTGIYTAPTNWSPNGVPGASDTAEFNTSGASATNITQISGSIGTLQFDSGAPAYSLGFGAGATTYTIGGAGVVDNAANKPTITFTAVSFSSSLIFNNSATAADINITSNTGSFFSSVTFNNTSTAGSANINLLGTLPTLTFNNSASAGNATIATNNVVNFNNSATAASANITIGSGGGLNLNNSATLSGATVTLNGGTLSGNGSSTWGSATISVLNNGGANLNGNADGGTAAVTMDNSAVIVDFSNSLGLNNNGQINIGSLAGGSANGTVFLGGNTVSVGGNNLSTTLGASIQDCNGDCLALGNPPMATAPGTLVKVGTGTLTLTGVNSYTGGTQINGGVLNVSADSGLGAATAPISFSGGTLQWGASFTLSGTRAITLNSGGGGIDTNGFSTTIAQAITGTGGLTKLGLGTLTLAGANSYGRSTTISAGTLALSAGGSLPASTALTDNGVFDMSATSGVSLASLSGSGGVTLGSKTLTLTAAGGTFSGVISGTGGLTVSGGTEVLSGANSYSGNTSISSGATLTLGAGGASGSVAGNVTDNGTLAFNRSDNVTWSNVISGSGALVQSGSGTLILTGAQTYSGGTSISAGTLQIGNGGTVGSITGNVTDNGTLIFAHSDTVSFSGVISGTGALKQNGGGNLILTGASTLTGPTSVNSGTLSVNGSIKSSSVTVNSGGTLGGTGTVGPTTVNSGGTIAPGNSIGTINVAGNLVLASGSTYHAELSPSANDKILASGTASVNGTLLADFQSGVSYTGGTRYTLITSSGALSGAFSSLSTLNLPSGLFAGLSYDANDAYLTLVNPQDGQIHVALTGAYVEDERLIRDAVLDHLLTNADGVRVWGEGFTAYGTIGSANVLQHNHSGFIAGVDLPVGDGITAGLAGAWTGYKASMPSHASRAVGETGHVVGYLGWAEDAASDSGWMLKAGGEYGWGVAAINRVSGADTDSNHESAGTAQIFGEAAFRDHFEGADLEPHADIIWVQTRNGAFQESGGPSAINGNALSESVSFARLGVRGLGRYIDLGSGIQIAPSLDIGWQAALSSPTPGLTVNVNNGAGAALLLGTPVAGNAGTAQLGAAIKLGDNADLHIGYDGIFSNGEVDHGVTARLEWRF